MRTTASLRPNDHMGLGRRKPTNGSADHMYGVFGFAPNLSVKKFQSVVSLSRLREP